MTRLTKSKIQAQNRINSKRSKEMDSILVDVNDVKFDEELFLRECEILREECRDKAYRLYTFKGHNCEEFIWNSRPGPVDDRVNEPDVPDHIFNRAHHMELIGKSEPRHNFIPAIGTRIFVDRYESPQEVIVKHLRWIEWHRREWGRNAELPDKQINENKIARRMMDAKVVKVTRIIRNRILTDRKKAEAGVAKAA